MSIQELEEKELIELVTPIAQELESGWNENDYEKFIHHVAQDMKESIDINNFKKTKNRSNFQIRQKHFR